MGQDEFGRRSAWLGGSPRTASAEAAPVDAERPRDASSHLAASAASERIVFPGIPPEFQPLRWRSPQEELSLRLQEARQVYAGSIRVAYDRFIYHPECQAIYIRFAACSAPTPHHVDLAIGMMTHKVSTLLNTLHWRAAPIILDSADLVVGQAAAAAWEQALFELLARACLTSSAGNRLFAQFNSQRRPDDVAVILDAVRRMQLMTVPESSQLRRAMLIAREEAEELVYVLWAEAQQLYQTVRLKPEPPIDAY